MVRCRFQKKASRHSVWLCVQRVRPRKKSFNCCFALAAVTLISGCTVGPDFAPPPSPEVSGYLPKSLPQQTAAAADAAGAPQHFGIGRDIPGDWWRVFGSQPLRTLVERALNNNPDLSAAQAALR